MEITMAELERLFEGKDRLWRKISVKVGKDFGYIWEEIDDIIKLRQVIFTIFRILIESQKGRAIKKRDTNRLISDFKALLVDKNALLQATNKHEIKEIEGKNPEKWFREVEATLDDIANVVERNTPRSLARVWPGMTRRDFLKKSGQAAGFAYLAGIPGFAMALAGKDMSLEGYFKLFRELVPYSDEELEQLKGKFTDEAAEQHLRDFLSAFKKLRNEYPIRNDRAILDYYYLVVLYARFTRLLTKKQLEISICSCELQDLILTLLSSSDWKSPVLEDPEKWLAINPHRYDIISPHGKFIHERISPERENAPMLEIVLFCQTHFRPGARQKTIALLPMHHDHIFQAGKTLIESQKFDFLGIEGYTGAYEIMQGVLNTTFCDGSPLNCATYILEESDWFSIRAGEKLEHEFKWRLNTYGIDDYEKAGLLPEEERDRIESKFAQIYFDYAIYRQKYELGLASGENLQDKAQRVLNNCRVIFEQYYKLLIERGLSAARVAIHHMIEKNLYKGLIVFGGLHFLQFKEIFDRFIDDEGLRKKLVTEANGNPKTTLSYWIFLPHNS